MPEAYFDCYSGISGDMTLGALVDLGVPILELQRALDQLHVPDLKLESRRIKRCGIGATHVTVHSDEKQPHRHFSHVKSIIEESGFSPSVKQRAIEAFHKIAVAEASVHETTVERIHFHEVGAVDAIADITGAMWCLEELGISNVLASQVAVGSGTVRAAHGEMPVPAPATALLLKNVPVTTGSMPGELTTPTGAAILTTICSRFGSIEGFSPEKVGYGAGTREAPGHTNYLRIILGSASHPQQHLPLEQQEVAVLQCEIDDMPGENFGYLMEKLFESGCLDVAMFPVQMKKNRPATSVQVITSPSEVEKAVEILMRETSTFGVRVSTCRRFALRRQVEVIEMAFGKVSIKIGYWGDTILKASPEYENCRAIARDKGIPLREVFSLVQNEILKRFNSPQS
jgi:uncharacterized protein (TIGR00299 family) protein